MTSMLSRLILRNVSFSRMLVHILTNSTCQTVRLSLFLFLLTDTRHTLLLYRDPLLHTPVDHGS